MATQTLVAPSWSGLSAPKIRLLSQTDGSEVAAAAVATTWGTASNLYTIDVTDLAAGTYLIVVVDGDDDMSMDVIEIALETDVFLSSTIGADVSSVTQEILTDTGTTLPGLIGGISGGGGSGARSVVITVVDNDTDAAIEGAIVRTTSAGGDFVEYTDPAGEISTTRDEYTWTVQVTAGALYQPLSASLVVGPLGATVEYRMIPVTVTQPPSPSTATGVMTLLNKQSSPKQNATASVQLISGDGTAGLGRDTEVWTETAGPSGLVQFAGLDRGSTYAIWRGKTVDRKVHFVVPDVAVFSLDEILGRD